MTIKTHGRRAKSLFRYGFDHLRTIVLNLNQKMDEFLDALRFLSCTYLFDTAGKASTQMVLEYINDPHYG